MQNKTMATATLATSALLAAGTMPGLSPLTNFAATSQLGNFFLGLFNHGFIAATIGGMADWFAVTALFHKPLGISYRTEILKNNRERITDALIEFVEKDLLTPQNIMDLVREEDTAKLLIDYFEEHQGREKIKSLTQEILKELFANADSKEISKAVAPILEGEMKNLDAEKIIDAAVKTLTNENHGRKILTALLETGRKILNSEHMQESILQKISELREAYEGDSTGRALVLSSMNLTDEKILTILNETVEKKISDTISVLNVRGMVDNKTSDAAKSLLATFSGFVKNAAADFDAKSFQSGLQKIIGEKFDSAKYIETWINVNVKGEVDPAVIEKITRQNAANPQHSRVVKIEKNNPIWLESVNNLIDSKIDEFIKSPILQGKFDKLIKNLVEKMLSEYHEQIPALIRERLDKWNDDELTEFVESHVADDLQMIRINGSVCGGIVGMLLYVVAFVINYFIG